MDKRRMHDGIVGAVIIVSFILARVISVKFLLIPLALGILLFLSAFTGFCPLYFLLDKTEKK